MRTTRQPQVSPGPEPGRVSSPWSFPAASLLRCCRTGAAAGRSFLWGHRAASRLASAPCTWTHNQMVLIKVLILVWFTETGPPEIFSSTGAVWTEPPRQNKRRYMCFCEGLIRVRRDTPAAEVLERSPHGEAGASDLDRLQHAGISELVQNQRLVELVRHLEADRHADVYVTVTKITTFMP